MNSFLLNRQLGSVSPESFAKAQNNRLLGSIQAAPDVGFALEKAERDASFDGSSRRNDVSPDLSRSGVRSAHAAGVNSITIDRFEGRYLLSGGADSSIALWDLEAAEAAPGQPVTHLPLAHKARSSTTQSLGITQVSFYPFDSLAFLTSGYDHHLKLVSSETLGTSAKFNLNSTIYSHATSSVASHLLVACASQHPAVRLVDLRSGASSHSLAGHSGSVLTVAWHPRDENILASGATDGCLRLWDIRRSASSLGVLDMDDSIGIAGYDKKGTGARRRERGRAHNGAVNGIVWSEDGKNLVSAGTDEKMRVWDVVAGANTLANYGPVLKNAQGTAIFPLLAPQRLTPTGNETVYYPNPQEILGFDLHGGNLIHRLRVTSPPASQNTGGGVRNLKPKTSSLVWRAHNIEMYSAHSDGTIRCWRPHTPEDALADEEARADSDIDGKTAEKKRKREELDQIVRDLTSKKVTYS